MALPLRQKLTKYMQNYDSIWWRRLPRWTELTKPHRFQQQMVKAWLRSRCWCWGGTWLCHWTRKLWIRTWTIWETKPRARDKAKYRKIYFSFEILHEWLLWWIWHASECFCSFWRPRSPSLLPPLSKRWRSPHGFWADLSGNLWPSWWQISWLPLLRAEGCSCRTGASTAPVSYILLRKQMNFPGLVIFPIQNLICQILTLS